MEIKNIPNKAYLILFLSILFLSVFLGFYIGTLIAPSVLYEFNEIEVLEEREPKYKCVPAHISNYICDLAEPLGLDTDLCISILLNENPEFKVDAIHKNNNGTIDCGLWQLNDRYIWTTFVPDYWNIEESFDPFNWKKNTFLALHHIKYLSEELKVFEDIVCAYNCGIGAVMREEIPDITKKYLAKATANYNLLKASVVD